MSFRPNQERMSRKHPGSTFFSLGAAALLLAWVAGPVSTTPASDCELAFEPAQVQAGTASTMVQAIPSEQLGEVTGVTAEEASGLAISLVEDQPLHLDVDATDAHGGEWAVTLMWEEEALCSGPLTVLGAQH